MKLKSRTDAEPCHVPSTAANRTAIELAALVTSTSFADVDSKTLSSSSVDSKRLCCYCSRDVLQSRSQRTQRRNQFGSAIILPHRPQSWPWLELTDRLVRDLPYSSENSDSNQVRVSSMIDLVVEESGLE